MIYSSSESLKWIRGVLKPGVEEQCNKCIALDIECELPGKFKVDNYLEINEKSDKVIVVLGPEITENKWLMYQIAVALMKRNPRKVLVCLLGQTDHHKSILKWLEPIPTCRIYHKFDQLPLEICKFVTENDV